MKLEMSHYQVSSSNEKSGEVGNEPLSGKPRDKKTL